MDVLKKINRLRLDRGWSVYKLAVEADIPQSTLTNMFNRETLPSITTLEMICRAYGITLSEFFEDDASDSSIIRTDDFIRAYEKLSTRDKDIVNKLIIRLLENN